MIRLLILGRPAQSWATRLADVLGEHVELDVARLPAEGIRRFEDMPPDALIVVDDTGGSRVPTLIKAIKQRPLGQLLPMILICPMPPHDQAQELARQMDLSAWLAPETSTQELCRVLAQELEMEVEELMPSKPRVISGGYEEDKPPLPNVINDMPTLFPDEYEDPDTPQPEPQESLRAQPMSSTQSGYHVEALEPGNMPAERVHFEPPPSAVEAIDRAALFPMRNPVSKRQSKVTIDVIRRKLRDVRHEDYYTILDVRRGAEGPTIRQAYQKQMARFDSESLDFELARRFFHELSEIRDAFDDAWAVLGDPELRDEYTLAGTRAY